MLRINILSFFCLLLCLQSVLTGTKFVLTSNNKSQQIPLVKQHSHSCQLIFFIVTDNMVGVNITNIDANITKVILQLNEQYSDLNKSAVISDKNVFFSLNFDNDIKTNQSKQFTVRFNLTLFDNDNNTYSQIRRVYVLFHIEGKIHYTIYLPLGSIIITQLFGLLLIFILPLNIQYRKLLPFTFNIVTCTIYIIILSISLYLNMISEDSEFIYQIQKWIVAVFSLIFVIIYTQDLLSSIFDNNRGVLVFSIILGTAMVLSDEICPALEGSWILNSIIAIMVAGAFIKFVIIRRIKTAIWAIVLMWVFSWLRQFAIVFGLQKFDQGMGIKIVPLFLQIPAISLFDNENGFICSAFGSSKIISFGIILNYCKRVDLFLSTNFYKSLGYMLTTLCILIELVYNLLLDELPTMQVLSVIMFYPIMIILMLFFANKRGEWAEIWHGSFYDMAVNRASIPREVHFDNMERTFGNDLLLNSNSLLDDK